jgi:hypothetical protein
VDARESAIRELRRVVAAGGTCVAVTNGSAHTRSLRALVGRAVRRETPGWPMRPATHAFTAENAAAQLGTTFESVTCVRPAMAPSAPAETWPPSSAANADQGSLDLNQT